MLGTILYYVAIAIALLVAAVVLRVTYLWTLGAEPLVPFPKGTYVLEPTTRAKWVGQLAEMADPHEECGEVHVRWMREARERGCSAIGFQLFAGSNMMMFTKEEDLAYLLVGEGQPFCLKHKYYPRLNFILGSQSLVTLIDPNEHRRMSRLVAPVFSQPSIRNIADRVMQKHLTDVVHEIDRHCASNAMPEGGGGIANIARLAQRFSLFTICESAWQRLEIAGVNVADTFLKANGSLTFAWTDMLDAVLQLPKWLRRKIPTKRNREGAKLISELSAASSHIIDEGRKVAAGTAQTKEGIADMGGRATILDMLVREKELNKEDIDSTIKTLTLAAFETTEKLIAATLYFLATHPDVQEKLCEELSDVIDVGQQPQLEDLQSLPYLNAVYKEAARLMPSAPWSGRVVTRDLTLPSGVTVPKGMMVSLNIYGMHLNPEIYGDDVDKFRPERWLDDKSEELVKRVGKCGWMPFLPLGHTRACLGRPLAEAELFLVVSTLARSYKMQWPPGAPKPRRTWGLTMWLSPEVKLHMQKRTA